MDKWERQKLQEKERQQDELDEGVVEERRLDALEAVKSFEKRAKKNKLRPPDELHLSPTQMKHLWSMIAPEDIIRMKEENEILDK